MGIDFLAENNLNFRQMQKGYFDSDSYHTPEKEHLSFREKILLNNRLYFTLKYAAIVLRTRKAGYQKSI